MSSPGDETPPAAPSGEQPDLDDERQSTPTVACTGWNNADCEGTPFCPPRCPRFFDGSGQAYLARAYQDGDFDSLVEMYESTTDSTMGLPPLTRTGIESWLERLVTRGWNLVAVDGDRVVGHLAVAPDDSPTPEFVVFVHDAYQGRGIGTELVKQAIARAATDGYEALTLLVSAGNQAAISVYRNAGFSAGSWEEADIEMWLDLEDPVADEVRLPPADWP